jgi:hypothetical protein
VCCVWLPQERFLKSKVLVQVEIAASKTFLDAVLLLQAPMPALGMEESGRDVPRHACCRLTIALSSIRKGLHPRTPSVVLGHEACLPFD